MQLYPLLLIAIVLAADSQFGDTAARFVESGRLSGWQIALASTAPLLIYLAAAWGGLVLVQRQIGQGLTPALVMAADRVLRVTRWFILLQHAAAVLLFGFLFVVRDAIGDLILVDELIALLPPLTAVAMTWWLFFPIERRMREAILLRRLDEGGTIHRVPSRGQYVLVQARLHLLPLLVPLLLIVGISEGVGRAAWTIDDQEISRAVAEGATMLAAGVVFLLSPVLVRVLLSVRPIPAGELRDDLLAVCERHDVRVRQLLLWETGGTMINAAVMGLFGPMRYVLLTDGLIETLTRKQLLGVMAHEVGHARMRHIPWLVVIVLAILMFVSLVTWLPVAGVALFTGGFTADTLMWIEHAQLVIAVALGLLLFGWVSRRFERQADTFAVRFLSEFVAEKENKDQPADRELPDAEGPHEQVVAAEHANAISTRAVAIMQTALGKVARLNMIDPKRRSWRHGSIKWRQMYLETIIGAPLDTLPIDRLVRRVKLASAAILLLGVAAAVIEAYIHSDRSDYVPRENDRIWVRMSESNTIGTNRASAISHMDE